MICPSSATTRYFTASRHSEYFVAVPTSAAIHIQNKAPGPPATIAVATPTILPVPMVADNAVHSAAKLDTSPSSPDFSLAIKCLIAWGSFVICKKRSLAVRKRPVARMRTIRGMPQTKSSTVVRKLLIMSNIFPLLPSPLVTSYRRLISSEENGNKHIDALSFCLRDWQLYCRTPSAPSIRKYENRFPWKDSPE